MAGSLREYISWQDPVKVGEDLDDHRLTVLQSEVAEMILTEVACIYLISRGNWYDVDAHIGPTILCLLMTGAGKPPRRHDESAGAEGDRIMKHLNAWDERMQDTSAAGNT